MHKGVRCLCMSAQFPLCLMLGEETLRAICAAVAKCQARHGKRLLVVGLSGPQGCGKSTAVVKLIERLQCTYGLCADYLSLDDYYLPWAHQLKGGRGPPGSHETTLLLAHVQALSAGTTVASPCYDKQAREGAGDRARRTRPVTGSALDVLLVEGWLLGYLADADGDDALAEYRAIWDQVDLWCCLRVNPGGLRPYVTRWRGKQEIVACREHGLPPPPSRHTASLLERFWPVYDRYYGRQPERLRAAFPGTPVLTFSLEDTECTAWGQTN